jgi:hypothetical protein
MAIGAKNREDKTNALAIPILLDISEDLLAEQVQLGATKI